MRFKGKHVSNASIKLNTGTRIPVIGFGTWKLEGRDVFEPLLHALDAGYRHIDTASMYKNDFYIGRAIKDSGVDRKDLFITTKIFFGGEIENPREALETQLRMLGTDYVNLYLIHFPVEGHVELWEKLVELKKDGLCRDIGVSNFVNRHLERVIEASHTLPAVNQVEYHPHFQQKEVLDYCRKKGIVVEAYCPLGQGRLLLTDFKLRDVASHYGKTPAQVMLRWALQHGMVVLPSSSKEAHIRENADVFSFELNDEHMQDLDYFHHPANRTCWHPDAPEHRGRTGE